VTLNDLHSVKIFEKYIFVFDLIVSLIEKPFTLDYHTSSKHFVPKNRNVSAIKEMLIYFDSNESKAN